MTMTSLVAVVAPRTGKIIKNGLSVINLHVVFRSEIELEESEFTQTRK